MYEEKNIMENVVLQRLIAMYNDLYLLRSRGFKFDEDEEKIFDNLTTFIEMHREWYK